VWSETWPAIPASRNPRSSRCIASIFVKTREIRDHHAEAALISAIFLS
jgi:hypothetical protein